MPLTVVGSINVDVTARVERLPAAGETVGGGELTRSPGGKGANQAVAAARLGAAVRMIGAVGDDADGSRSLADLEASGVDADAVRTVGAPTGTALIGVDAAGENQIIVAPGANARVTPDHLSIGPDDVVLTQLEIPLDTVAAIADARPAFFVVNAAPAQHLPAGVVDRVDLFIVNETEYELLPELARAARVAVTYGEAGAAMFEHGREVARVPALPALPVNTVGAGDAFCAALTIALRRGLSDEAALSAACAVGATAVEDPSSQPALKALDHYVAG
ncbi:ribokinase [Microbacterium indicum]|uniref:ribokinase n=1 Tax=Microbacterium indicum TaxID=358100 RepID=UPI000413962F|nr:ribokinase [Microbacterium indicum]